MKTVGRATRATLLLTLSVVMIVPLYLLLVNAFKPQQSILLDPFGISVEDLSLQYMSDALTATRFNVVQAYGVTILFVVVVCLLNLLVTIPAAYVIARGAGRRHRALLLVLLAGLFIPGQVLLIPVIYILRALGLMGTVGGFILFETALTIPVSIFLFSGFIMSIPRELDEAAMIDGASRWRTIWTIITPLMKPAIATAMILHAIGVWSDFVNPQIILGPSAGIYTVTTGVYAAISQYTTDFTLVYPNLLLAIAPLIIFFVFAQRYIVSGLTAGAVKG